jgi:CSLREA domain-containing protein
MSVPPILPRWPRVVAAVALALMSATTAGGPVHAGAATIFVTTTEDEVNADGDCSLREAVIAANTDAPVDACPAGAPDFDTIGLEPLRYELTLAGEGEDAAATGDLDLLGRVSFSGAQGGTRIDAGGLDRIFDIAAGVTASFHGLELSGGQAAGGFGGAIYLRDSCPDVSPPLLIVSDAIIGGNRAQSGGGIYAEGCRTLWIIDTAVVDNDASAHGGGIAVNGPTSLSRLENATISGNTATAAGGGVWHSAGTDDLYQGWIFTTIARNSSPSGAGVWSVGDPPYLIASILAENDGPDCVGLVTGPDVVTDDASCLESWQQPAVAALGPLTMVRPAGETDHGGNFTFVHPLLPGSHAIDSGSGDDCASLWPVDQAQNSRPQDGNSDGILACDAGAFEAPTGTAPPPTPPQGPPSSGGGATPEPVLPDTAMPREESEPEAPPTDST